jgi:hypothetical protein
MRYIVMKRITFTPRATTQWLKLSQDVRRRVNAGCCVSPKLAKATSKG